MTEEREGSRSRPRAAPVPNSVRVGGVDSTELLDVGHILNAPGRRLTWLTILKASVAVALAWQVASALPGDDAPVFAPIVALTTVQSSVYGTFAQAFQTVAGNIIGVALATVFVNIAGRTAVALFVATFVGLAVSKRLPIGSGARGQVTLAMVVVIALGPTSGYASARLVDCAIGGAVGIIVALCIPERPQLAPVHSAIAVWAGGLRSSLQEIATALSTRDAAPIPAGEQHGFVDRMLDRLRAADQDLTSALAGALESTRFNPRGHRRADQVQELADVLAWLRRLSLQVQALALGVDALYDRASHQPRLDRQTLSELLFAVAGLVPDQTVAEDESAVDLRRTLANILGQATEDEASVARVLDSVSLLGRVDHLVVELTDPSVVPVGDASTRPLTTERRAAGAGERGHRAQAAPPSRIRGRRHHLGGRGRRHHLEGAPPRMSRVS